MDNLQATEHPSTQVQGPFRAVVLAGVRRTMRRMSHTLIFLQWAHLASSIDRRRTHPNPGRRIHASTPQHFRKGILSSEPRRSPVLSLQLECRATSPLFWPWPRFMQYGEYSTSSSLRTTSTTFLGHRPRRFLQVRMTLNVILIVVLTLR